MSPPPRRRVLERESRLRDSYSCRLTRTKYATTKMTATATRAKGRRSARSEDGVVGTVYVTTIPMEVTDHGTELVSKMMYSPALRSAWVHGCVPSQTVAAIVWLAKAWVMSGIGQLVRLAQDEYPGLAKYSKDTPTETLAVWFFFAHAKMVTLSMEAPPGIETSVIKYVPRPLSN